MRGELPKAIPMEARGGVGTKIWEKGETDYSVSRTEVSYKLITHVGVTHY